MGDLFLPRWGPVSSSRSYRVFHYCGISYHNPSDLCCPVPDRSIAELCACLTKDSPALSHSQSLQTRHTKGIGEVDWHVWRKGAERGCLSLKPFEECGSKDRICRLAGILPPGLGCLHGRGHWPLSRWPWKHPAAPYHACAHCEIRAGEDTRLDP